MTAPSPTVQYGGLGVVTADQLNTFMQTVVNIAQLRTFTGLNSMICCCQGATSPGDGGGGIYYYNSSSTASDNGSTVIVPTGNIQGAWLLLALSATPNKITSGPISGISLSSGTPKNITSITLTPGTWTLWASLNLSPASSTVLEAAQAVISLTSGTLTAIQDDVALNVPTLTNAGDDFSSPVGQTVVTISVDTTYYLVAQAAFTTSTLTGGGILSALQVL